MLNTGKEGYGQMTIPDGELLAAIGRGIRRSRRERQRRMAKGFVAAAASAAVLLFCSANVPQIYAYASEIPVIRTFVQALRVGSGGSRMEDVSLVVTADSSDIDFVFAGGDGMTEEVQAYEVASYDAPVRIALTFYGLNDTQYEMIREKLLGITGVWDVYPAITPEGEAVSLVVVLKRLYNYEVMEFSKPGSLSIHFFQDAYYTQGERHPDEAVYYVRTEGVPYGAQLEKLLRTYQTENPAQIKTQEGNYILAMGGYSSELEAEEALEELLAKYGKGAALSVGSGTVSEIPHDMSENR